MRERASEALASFNDIAEASAVSADARHVEGDLRDVMVAASSADLVVVPAGVDVEGRETCLNDEIASEIAAAHTAPVLRVLKRPSGTGRVAFIVDRDPNCRRLAHNFLSTGLMPGAEITILPVGVDDEAVQAQCAEIAQLLAAHGRSVDVSEPIDLLADHHFILEQLRPMDMVAMTKLTGRTGWFSQAREDAHETAATSAPLTLLV